ncbi:MAG: DNA internalization-related competence protein ComEC/Rec2 [Anaerolineae bacterium]
MHIVLLTLLWLAGIWVASLAPSLSLVWWWVPGATALAAALPLIYLPKLRRYTLYLAYIACFFLGGARFLWSQPVIDETHISSYLDQWGVTITGRVTDEPDIRDQVINLRVETSEIKLPDGTIYPAQGAVLLRTPRFPIIEYGTELTFSGDLETPFETAEFSYRDYLNRQGVYGVMSFPRIQESSAGHGHWLLTELYQIKQRAQTLIAKNVRAPESGLLSGILLGIDHTMPPDIEDDFRTVGITHIVVISGFNIAILSSIFLALFTPIFGRRGAAFAAIAAIILFTLLVGADPSVVRAAIMGGLYVLTGRLVGRRNAPIPILFLTAFGMTLLNPNALWDIGFQLSFAATLSLMLFAKPLTDKVREWLKNRYSAAGTRAVMQAIGDSVLVTIAAQILTLPLIMYYFGQLSVISILTNGLVLPVQPLIMVWGGLTVISGFFMPVLAQMLGWIVWVFLFYTVQVAELLAQMPFASVAVPFGLGALIFTYVSIGASTWFYQQEIEFREKWIGIIRADFGRRAMVGMSAVMLVLGWQWQGSQPDGLLHVTYFDVGQGDATLIQTPSGRQILIDGGYFPTVINRHLGQTMPLGDREIDLLLVTHPDADHVTGLPELFDRYKFDQLLVSYLPGDWSGEDGPYAETLERAVAQGAEIIRPQAGDVIMVEDGLQLEIVHPGPSLAADNRNDNSLSVRLIYGATTMLFTGDAEEAGERAMLQSDLPLESAIYKAGHHGANNASGAEFLDVIRPQVVIISAGLDNRFGHPHPELLARLQAVGTVVLRTDTMGSIEIISDGEQTWWRSEK